jgi:hypothetical protein
MENSVPLADVLVVLQLRKVSLSVVDTANHRYILAKDGYVEELTFHDPVGKKMLKYLSRRYDIYMHFFWHPEMAHLKPGEWPQ